MNTGELFIKTTKDFTTTDAKYMQVAVCMFSKPAFVMHGKPNGSYLITTKPTYYVAVTDAKEGTVISAAFVSSP